MPKPDFSIQRHLSGRAQLDILLIPGFDLGDLAALCDCLRLGQRHATAIGLAAGIEIRLLGLKTGEVTSSSGLAVRVDASLDESGGSGELCVLAGSGIVLREAREIARKAWSGISGRHHQGAKIFAVAGATLILAAYRMFSDRELIGPWHCVDAWREQLPEIKFSDRLVANDRGVITCAGGAATVELTLHMVQSHFSGAVRRKCVASLNATDRWMTDARQNIDEFVGAGRLPPKVSAAISLMRRHIEYPVDTHDIAAELEVSSRQLQRLFNRHLGETPTARYKRIRLRRARQLIRHTEMNVTEVAVATGFTSMSHFSRCYRELFMLAPVADRTQP